MNELWAELHKLHFIGVYLLLALKSDPYSEFAYE